MGEKTMKPGPCPAVTLAAALLALAGCSNEDPTTGRLSLFVTDAPVDDATAVVVEFTGVEVKPAGGEALAFDFDAPRSIDLLALSGTDSEGLLEGVEVPAGRYEWVRLAVNAATGVEDSWIDLEDGSRHELEIPSGAQTGLKLHSGFNVPAGGAASFTVDFDLRKSVHPPMNEGGAYLLRPTLRIVDNAQVGAIAGTVAAALVTEGCEPAIYVFEGSGVTPDDVDGTAPEPVTTARVELDPGSGQYGYTAGFLSAGEYTVAFTCDADDDDPATDDTLAFSGTQPAVVTAGQTTAVSFAAGS
jgi:hypothetical protein